MVLLEVMVILTGLELLVAPPDQPLKMEPDEGAAVRATTVFAPKEACAVLLEAPQFIPVGELVTVPVPSPVLFIVIVYLEAGGALFTPPRTGQTAYRYAALD